MVLRSKPIWSLVDGHFIEELFQIRKQCARDVHPPSIRSVQEKPNSSGTTDNAQKRQQTAQQRTHNLSM